MYALFFFVLIDILDFSFLGNSLIGDSTRTPSPKWLEGGVYPFLRMPQRQMERAEKLE